MLYVVCWKLNVERCFLTMSLWGFRFLLWYICVLCIQPQNRFQFLHPLHIADICAILAIMLHFISASSEGRPIIRMGPATITAILLMIFSFISLQVGYYQTDQSWNSDIDIVFKNCLVLILVEAMSHTVERVWAVQTTLFLATLWWIKGGLRLASAGATYTGDRIMGPAVSLIENPNGFAYLLTVMIPLYLYFYQKATNRYIRLGCLALAISAVYIVLQTGSRTGLLALIAVGVFLLPKYGAKHKGVIAVVAVAVFVFSTSLGALNVERFKTIPTSIKAFVSGADEDANLDSMNQDEQSAWERKMKNKHTWQLILTYPLFGVGVAANDELVMREFSFAGGQVHNEILYAGKQMGIIGMGLYLSFMFIIFIKGREVQVATAHWWPAASDIGWTFTMQCIVFVVGGFFSPIPWNPIYLIIAGSASALAANLTEKSYVARQGYS